MRTFRSRRLVHFAILLLLSCSGARERTSAAIDQSGYSAQDERLGPRVPRRTDWARELRAYGALPKAIGADNWESIGPTHILQGRQGTASASPQQRRPLLLGIGQISAIGRVDAVAPHPTDPKTIYIAAATGGVWKTIDDGVTWRPLTDSQCSLRISSLVVDPVSPNIVYAGTQDCGILRSVDAGDSWQNFQVVHRFETVTSIVIDPLTAGSTRGTVLYVGLRQFGLFRSTDSGQTFVNVISETGSTSLDVLDVAVDPVNSLVVYAVARTSAGTPSNTYSVRKSVNGGLTWTTTTVAIGQATHASLTVATSQVLYLSAPVAGRNAGMVFRSVNGGTTWTTVSSPEPSRHPDHGGADVLGADPGDSQVVYFGGLGLRRSSDGGQTWVVLGSNVHVDYHDIHFDRAGRIYVGNDGGIWRSSDKGSTWIPLNNGLTITQFGSVAVSTDYTVVYGGTQDNGVLSFRPAQPSWRSVIAGDGGGVEIDPTDNNVIYADVAFNGFFKCTQNGCTRSENGLPSSGCGVLASRLGSAVTLYCLKPEGLYKSTDLAATWKRALGTIPGTVFRLVTAPTNPNVLYAVIADGGFKVVKSQNGGDTWSVVFVPPNQNGISLLAVDGDDDKTAYYSAYGGNTVFGPALFRTTDGGFNWAPVQNFPEGLTATTLTSHVNQGSKAIFVATLAGVLRSLDAGVTWQTFGKGLPHVDVTEFAVAPAAGILVASTYGRGMFAISIR